MATVNKPLRNTICPICQNNDAFFAIGTTDKGVPLVSCPKCKTVFAEPSSTEISEDLPLPVGEKVKDVFGRLDQLRGYRPPKRKAEAASIIRMLKQYTPNQIIDIWQQIKQDKFWLDKELFMMTVESQIGAVLKNGTHRQNPRAIKRPEEYTDPNALRHS